MSTSTRRITLLVVLLAGVAACQPATGSISPSATASVPVASSAALPSEPSLSAESLSPALAGQTDTGWGRIWDSLPASFPAYPGSTPAEGATGGPATAVLALEGVEAQTIARWMQSMLERASYSTEALSGPLEDGSYVLDSTGGAPGCRVQVSVAPLGGLTTVTVLYGASCPQP